MKIGVFDSGVGGLTVVKEIIKYFPNASIIYIGDTARVPYGSKGKKTIIRYAKEITNYLLKQKVDAIVVACNTVSSVAINELKKNTDIPIIDMINPVVLEAVKKTKNKKIAIIGTKATINSHAYKKQIQKIDGKINIYEKACPLFVPIVEEGLISHKITDIVIKYYLNKKYIDSVDTIILGCTHYPILKDQIKKNIKNVNLISCGSPAAKKLKIIFKAKKNIKKNKKDFTCLVTDDPVSFKKTAEKFLGKKINKIKILSLERI